MKPVRTAAALLTAAALTVSVAGAATASSDNDRVPQGATWTQHYFPSSGGAELHADVLLPEGLPEGQRVPVILSVGPYFGHSGQKSKEDWKTAGPSDRFSDFIEGTKLFERG